MTLANVDFWEKGTIYIGNLEKKSTSKDIWKKVHWWTVGKNNNSGEGSETEMVGAHREDE